ncbi:MULTISPECIES: TRAP transporter large permease [Sporosarcina]|uniref:C4-dicarboxylate transporter, DctM subunit n=1 Tax=Sporosarcina newyorkensis TaxID=759851 RepID=A0A1T4YWH3_9BACL|nr:MULTISPECIES: TRAP transporter large permease [Sporosarcina]MBY0222892.1 TRAP transporter large permease [Sporosarcina aquimarina]SKB06144.1 C4-dicarboxylate transporter, DctM subunit [Sporosarcina newyorkensis]
MTALILFGLFFILVMLRMPIAVALAISSIAVLFTGSGLFGLELVADIMYTSVAKFTLLAIPFFILAGVIMEYAGISKRLIDFAQALVGHRKSGIIFVTVMTAIFFAAISGSGPATVAAIGGILIPGMVKNGYKVETAAGLVASSGAIGIIIPPSIAFIVFAVVAGDQIPVSIGRLFMAGVIPGLLLGLGFILAAMFVRRGQEKQEGPVAAQQKTEPATGKERFQAFISAIWGLLIPVIILGGIYGGFFTPTEAAVVAVFYSLFIGFFIYRELTLKKLYDILVAAGVQTAVVMFIVSAASVYAYIITTEQIASQVSDVMLSFSDNKIIILLLINMILLIAGMFIDAISAYYIFVPILLPIVLMFDVDPTVFGVFMTVNLAIGLFTPPVGLNLFVAAGISNTSIGQISRGVFPFVVSSVIILLLITFIPQISTFLPDLLNIK